MSVSQFRYSRIPAEAEAIRGEVRAFLARSAVAAVRPCAAPIPGWASTPTSAASSARAAGSAWRCRSATAARSRPVRALRRDRGVARRRRTRVGALDRRPAERAAAPALWQRGAEGAPSCPRICRGEQYFCIGMSEPGSGSDLASISAARGRDGDGWVLSGQKLWTTNAHHSHYMIALVRTAGKARGAPRGHVAVHRRPEGAGRHDPPDPRPHRQRAFQRSVLRRRAARRRRADRQPKARAGSRSPPSWRSSAAGRSAFSAASRCCTR